MKVIHLLRKKLGDRLLGWFGCLHFIHRRCVQWQLLCIRFRHIDVQKRYYCHKLFQFHHDEKNWYIILSYGTSDSLQSNIGFRLRRPRRSSAYQDHDDDCVLHQSHIIDLPMNWLLRCLHSLTWEGRSWRSGQRHSWFEEEEWWRRIVRMYDVERRVSINRYRYHWRRKKGGSMTRRWLLLLLSGWMARGCKFQWCDSAC